MKLLHIGNIPEGGQFPRAILSMGDIVQHVTRKPIGWYVCICIPTPFYELVYRPATDRWQAGLGEKCIAFCHDDLASLGYPPPAIPGLRWHKWTDLWKVKRQLLRVHEVTGNHGPQPTWRWIDT